MAWTLRIDTLAAAYSFIENKSVQATLSVHEAHLLTYLKLSGLRLGFLVNWNVPLNKNGIKRMANKLSHREDAKSAKGKGNQQVHPPHSWQIRGENWS